jgi:hypothetical protein
MGKLTLVELRRTFDAIQLLHDNEPRLDGIRGGGAAVVLMF